MNVQKKKKNNLSFYIITNGRPKNHTVLRQFLTQIVHFANNVVICCQSKN